MRIWRFDSQGWLVAEGEAPEGLYPADATDVPPPAIEGNLVPRWLGAHWSLQAPPVPTPELVFTLEPIGPDATKTSIVGMEATVLYRDDHANGVKAMVKVTVAGHVLDGTDGFPSFDHAFRMPFQPVDAFDRPAGTPIKKLIQFQAGVAEVEFNPELPCDWLVTQEAIGARLAEAEMVQLPTPVRIVAVK